MVDILVYMQDGRVFQYKVHDCASAREHAHRIVTQGYRSAVDGVMEYYPVHQILKVKFEICEDDYLAGKYETNSTAFYCSECGSVLIGGHCSANCTHRGV